jgi:hypothetical protein
MDEKNYRALLDVIAYLLLLPEEKKHWEGTGKSPAQIYASIKQLADWADEVAKDY